MKKKLSGALAGVLAVTLFCGGAAFAKKTTETIEVQYSNIKVYKDNVLCELKDANGKTVEPFIYNGTTYMPVRGTASLADMQVTWDGESKSVYLWDDLSPEGTAFLEVCPPYDSKECVKYLASNGKSFTMAGERYSDGLGFSWDGSALFNLNGNYSAIECTIGHTSSEGYGKSVSFIVDGKNVLTVELEAECLPKTVLVPLDHGLQLKIVTDGSYIGIGNMYVK